MFNEEITLQCGRTRALQRRFHETFAVAKIEFHLFSNFNAAEIHWNRMTYIKRLGQPKIWIKFQNKEGTKTFGLKTNLQQSLVAHEQLTSRLSVGSSWARVIPGSIGRATDFWYSRRYQVRFRPSDQLHINFIEPLGSYFCWHYNE